MRTIPTNCGRHLRPAGTPAIERRYQVLACGSVLCACNELATAEREARQYSRNTSNRCAQVFDLAAKMIVYRARNGAAS